MVSTTFISPLSFFLSDAMLVRVSALEKNDRPWWVDNTHLPRSSTTSSPIHANRHTLPIEDGALVRSTLRPV